jgi:hypothetical protein
MIELDSILITCIMYTSFSLYHYLPNAHFFQKSVNCMISLHVSSFDIHGSVHRRLLSRNTNKMQLCNRIYFLKAQHVSSGTPLIIRSSKLYLQPMVYMTIWWPAIAKHFPLSLGNGRSPYGHINHRLQIQFRAPDDERSAAGNMLSLQKTLE